MDGVSVGFHQVDLCVGSDHKVPKTLAVAVSIDLGGTGEVWLEDSGSDWDLWVINMPEPFNGSIVVNGVWVTVETPLF